MKKRVLSVAIAGLLMGAGSVQAEENMGIGVGARVSTLGYGLELTKGINDNFRARLGFNTYSTSETETQDDINYDMDLDWRTIGLFADWHPFSNGFRLTLGYVNNRNEIDMQAAATTGQTVTIDGVDYTIGNELGSLVGNVSFSNGLFYGLGWSNAGKSKGWGFTAEAGILQQDPSLDLYAVNVDPAVAAALNADVQAEIAQAEADLDDFSRYPVIAVGVSYSF